MDSFFIQQRVRMVEALTSGCIEQANVYDVFDSDNKRIMIIKEESDGCSRCCCAPNHSVLVRFYLVGKDAPELKPGQKVDWSYEPSSPPFMTFEREGCDCCIGDGPCPKPCIGCFAVSESCRQNGVLYSGDLTGQPGASNKDRSKLLGESVQPPGGGGFKPVMQIMERADANDPTGKTELFAASRGPCCTGGCSKLCFEALFGFAKVQPDMENDSSKLHTANFGEYATITKLKPKTMGQAVREAFTDSDLFDVKFLAKEITPQQKANVLAQLVHLDYMFFERDNDMCKPEGGGVRITFANCFVYGCICPCSVLLKSQN
jgi:hypothetical protein